MPASDSVCLLPASDSLCPLSSHKQAAIETLFLDSGAATTHGHLFRISPRRHDLLKSVELYLIWGI